MKRISILILFIIYLLPGIVLCDDQIHYTNTAIEIYGYSDKLLKGDILSVYDSDDVLCGEFKVMVNGQYGLMSVYGDDSLSKDIDEGAIRGDKLTMYLNGEMLLPGNMNDIVWTENGDRVRVDF